jgi:hypothetical protein
VTKPIKLWQGTLIMLLVAATIWCGYVVYHIYWGALS